MPQNLVAFVSNRGYGLTSSRKTLVKRFLDLGWKVVVITANDSESRELRAMGCHPEYVTFSRGGISPFSDLTAFKRLRAIYRYWRPDLIHHFNAKPVVLGSLAAHSVLGEHARIVNTITGLGRAFVVSKVTARIAAIGYRAALSRSSATIFQNMDDYSLFLRKQWVPQDKMYLICGSGVDVEHFAFVERDGRDGCRPTVVMLSRLLRQKGIPEFVEVAHRVREIYPRVRFVLAGEQELGHSDAVSMEWLRKQADVDYVGRLSDVRPVLADADLFLFPSYYREGVPRVVLEASATGLPVIGFDVPGVREVICNGETGYLVASRNLNEMVNRVITLLNQRPLRYRMSRAAREIVERKFGLQEVAASHFQLYRDLGASV